MTPREFRNLALKLPEVVGSSHMQHPDFRVGGKIFATLGCPSEEFAMVKLTPDDQELFVQIDPDGFSPVKGGWGRQGATSIRLASARKAVVRDALRAAWRLRAPGSSLERPASLRTARPRRTRN